MNSLKDYKRMNENSMVFGVLSGFAYHFKLPTWLVRLLFFLLVISTGVGIAVYVAVYIFTDSYKTDPKDYKEVCG